MNLLAVDHIGQEEMVSNSRGFEPQARRVIKVGEGRILDMGMGRRGGTYAVMTNAIVFSLSLETKILMGPRSKFSKGFEEPGFSLLATKTHFDFRFSKVTSHISFIGQMGNRET